jgi:hypothetical protein
MDLEWVMKKICIALFFSLFTSLIHVAIMPMELLANQSHQLITVVDVAAHHCDEVVAKVQDKNTNQQCHGDSYQCCLGFVVLPLLGAKLSVASAEKLIAQQSSLTIQPMVNYIYKPPKA